MSNTETLAGLILFVFNMFVIYVLCWIVWAILVTVRNWVRMVFKVRRKV